MHQIFSNLTGLQDLSGLTLDLSGLTLSCASSVILTDGKGLSQLKITRDGNGPKVKLSYLAPGASGFGQAQSIESGRDETYLLRGRDPQTSALTVAVKANDFYTSSQVSQVVATGKPLVITQDLY